MCSKSKVLLSSRKCRPNWIMKMVSIYFRTSHCVLLTLFVVCDWHSVTKMAKTDDNLYRFFFPLSLFTRRNCNGTIYWCTEQRWFRLCKSCLQVSVNFDVDILVCLFVSCDLTFLSYFRIGEIVQNRQAKLWLHPDILFRLTSQYAEHKKCIDILHGFSYRVINERKAELVENNNNDNNNSENSVNKNLQNDHDLSKFEIVDFPKKKRLAFLDLLIEYSQNGTVLSDEDIREEVDTFMFEGHDTTSASISWTLFLLGTSPEIQERVVEEIDLVMCGDRERAPTMKELNEMKYLECAIKDSLRLYPSVPFMGRQINEDVVLGAYNSIKFDFGPILAQIVLFNSGEYTVPAGTTCLISSYVLHRDPKVFPRPEKFNPDNFLPENVKGRNPYAYIPFSAGPRNCESTKTSLEISFVTGNFSFV